MKHTLALVLMVFGLVGCTSSSWETYKVYKPEFNLKNSQVTQNIKNGIPAGRFNNFCTFDGGWPGGEETQQLVDITQFNLFVQNAQVISSFSDAKYDYIKDDSQLVDVSNGYTNIKTGEKFIFGNFRINNIDQVKCMNNFLKEICESISGSACINSHWMEKNYESRVNEYRTRLANKTQKEEKLRAMQLVIEKEKEEARLKREKTQRAKQEQEILAELQSRCEKLGFEGEQNINACIKREAKIDLELALQRRELAKTKILLAEAEARAYVESFNTVQPVEEEEDTPFLIKFLGDVVLGVVEQYPAAKLEAQKRQEAYNRGVRKGQAAQRAACQGRTNC